ncbi:hypothetical protein DICVIV_09718 [Dictyocaulus viviparus]|uniref:FMP27/BLTP2/Hobbit GFWDK motif-containing RBG unit domain-containing protein n=1 Tax=Dictyocaulus viviparus TaxID=29172 RepID=A0A0D8XPG2_DICVI|nr:hypothetical protein DICVIV_09718 [Dictyocaulus viviparus]
MKGSGKMQTRLLGLSIEDQSHVCAVRTNLLILSLEVENVLEIGVDSFCIAGSNTKLPDATFERHQWGHSVYVGAAFVQYSLSDFTSDILIGVDDCKIEWSDGLLDQITKLLEVFSISYPTKHTVVTSELHFSVRIQMKSIFFRQEQMSKISSRSMDPVHYKILTSFPIEFVMNLPRYHRILWCVPSLTFEVSSGNFCLISPRLRFNTLTTHRMFASLVVRLILKWMLFAADLSISPLLQTKRVSIVHSDMVWTWEATSFVFYLPFEFNFAQTFDEFVNCIKWVKIVHGLKNEPFPPNAPLPADIRLLFKEARLELEDDPFEILLQMSHELKEDEVYECERRRQMLADRLLAFKKSNPLVPQARIDDLFAMLLEKNSAIYVERWNKANNTKRPLFESKWINWDLRAFADHSLHGFERCVELIREFDPLSTYPVGGMQFSTLWSRGVELDVNEWSITFKDYPIPYLLAKNLHFFGTLVGAEEFEERGRSLRECQVPLSKPWESHLVLRNMAPLKFYYDMQCESSDFSATYGPCWEPCLSMISLMWNNINAPSKDPSVPLPFWDKMRFLLHGRFSWLSSKVVTTMLASPDPYNTTETVEMCWNEFGLDWALVISFIVGEVRIRSALHVFMRTASRYDDSRILFLPDLRLRIVLDWVCSGDPHDHHGVTLCAPHRLPHYSMDHDSYRAFRSSSLDLSLSFDVAPGTGNGETGDRLPHVLLYANTFRCIEFLVGPINDNSDQQCYNTLTMKNRNVRKGRLFGTPLYPKPQLGKHFQNVQVSLNFPKFYITYWMSHSSDYGFRLISDGLNLLASVKLTVRAGNSEGIIRCRSCIWHPQHVSATLWGTQIHVYSNGHTPSVDGISSDEETFLLGLHRVSYVRENNRVGESAQHRLTVHDLKASWTAQNRDACITIADSVHRAHMLRRILSNDALKILKLHMEDEGQSMSTGMPSVDSFTPKEGGHRRGFSLSDQNQSLLNQLIGEASTRLVAHCEQYGVNIDSYCFKATDLPTDSLLGALQCTSDDVRNINWQIDLLNSQAVLKGCERAGFVLLTAARASVTQKYFAPISIPNGRSIGSFKWLPKEVIEEKTPTGVVDDPYLHPYIGAGEAVGGVVEAEESPEKIQLQRIVSRCSCEIYFCYFSEELKTDALEETGVPKIEQEIAFGGEEMGVDCFTLKHNMLEASSNSEQYEMMVDIVNNLVLFVDPKKKELAERRRKLRFACKMADMNEMRERIVEQQSDLREIVSVVRSLERQLFYLDTQSDGDIDEQKRREIVEEMEEQKVKQLEVSDKLAIYISCYKQRQVEAARATVCSKLEEEDVLAIFLPKQSHFYLQGSSRYKRTVRIDSSGEHLFEVGTIRVTNLLPDTIYRDTLHRDERVQTRQPSIRLMVRDMAPVGGICVKELFEVNIAPMVAQLTYRFFEKIMLFFFPGRNIHKEDNLDAVDDSTPKFSFTRRIAGTLSMRSGKSAQSERKGSNSSNKHIYGKQTAYVELTDIDKMRERADNNNFFLYIKIPEVPFVVSYKNPTLHHGRCR